MGDRAASLGIAHILCDVVYKRTTVVSENGENLFHDPKDVATHHVGFIFVFEGSVAGVRGFIILSRTDAPVLSPSDKGAAVTAGKGECNKVARDVTACNKVAHSRVTGGVGVSVLKRTKSRKATVHDDSGRELAKESKPEDPFSMAVADRSGGNAPERKSQH